MLVALGEAAGRTAWTVTSPDGSPVTYAVTDQTAIGTASGTLADLQVGDTVLVEALVEDGTATALSVLCSNARQAARFCPVSGSTCCARCRPAPPAGR